MADFNYIICPPYNRNQDHFPLFPNTTSPRLNRCIENAIQRFKILIENGFMTPKNSHGKPSLLRVALIRAAIGYCKIFIYTVSQIANWSPKAKELIKRGEEIIDTLRQRWDGESNEDSLMPNISPYELVIKIIIEEQIDRDTRPRKQLNVLMEKLKKLYNPILQPEQIEHDGIPRIIVFCYNANATPELAVATSPEKWWPGSFLMHWAAISRQSRLGAGGQQIIKNLINQVDNRVNEEVVKANLRSQKLGVRNLAMTGDSLLELNGFVAQAFDGKSFLPRERCWRCRLTFGFNWLWPEGDPKGLSVAKIKDFEFRWDNASDTRKGGEGKCGEYILWWNYIANITQRSTPSAPDSST